jgi:hypothetical protein
MKIFPHWKFSASCKQNLLLREIPPVIVTTQSVQIQADANDANITFYNIYNLTTTDAWNRVRLSTQH